MTDRELDVLVATHVFGCPVSNGMMQLPDEDGWKKYLTVPKFSGSIDQAWLVVDALRAKGLTCVLTLGADGNQSAAMFVDVPAAPWPVRDLVYHAKHYLTRVRDVKGEAQDTSPARAICLAALHTFGMWVS